MIFHFIFTLAAFLRHLFPCPLLLYPLPSFLQPWPPRRHRRRRRPQARQDPTKPRRSEPGTRGRSRRRPSPSRCSPAALPAECEFFLSLPDRRLSEGKRGVCFESDRSRWHATFWCLPLEVGKREANRCTRRSRVPFFLHHRDDIGLMTMSRRFFFFEQFSSLFSLCLALRPLCRFLGSPAVSSDLGTFYFCEIEEGEKREGVGHCKSSCSEEQKTRPPHPPSLAALLSLFSLPPPPKKNSLFKTAPAPPSPRSSASRSSCRSRATRRSTLACGRGWRGW